MLKEDYKEIIYSTFSYGRTTKISINVIWFKSIFRVCTNPFKISHSLTKKKGMTQVKSCKDRYNNLYMSI